MVQEKLLKEPQWGMLWFLHLVDRLCCFQVSVQCGHLAAVFKQYSLNVIVADRERKCGPLIFGWLKLLML